MQLSTVSPPVAAYRDRQYCTGEEFYSANWLPDAVYGQALDALVVACVDVIPLYRKRMLIGRRIWQPQADWWVFGGRMQKGELYHTSAVRNIARELFHGQMIPDLSPDRFQITGVYNLIWDQRAQEPMNAGCHHLSVTMMVHFSRQEVASISANEEFSELRWIAPSFLIANANEYHLCLAQMARDVLRLLDPKAQRA